MALPYGAQEYAILSAVVEAKVESPGVVTMVDCPVASVPDVLVAAASVANPSVASPSVADT